jgi:LmbE family N-acetylglucosaminyl deacetylase
MDAVEPGLIHGGSTPESVWLPWLATSTLRYVTLDCLVPGNSRLVVVSPHPDDEVLMCGALIALQAQSGQPILVVAVTDGDASHGTDDVTARAELGRLRREESAAGLAHLGAGDCHILRLGIPDGEVLEHQQRLSEHLRALLRPGDVVVSTWHHDGHPDHEGVAAATRNACDAVGCTHWQAPVWMWHWSFPSDTRVPWPQMVVLPIASKLVALKQNALRCHQSQLTTDHRRAEPVLGEAIYQRSARAFEYFFKS